jgi:hypothetical protein
MGESVNSADLYDASLPELPFRAAATIRSVRALADYLGRLDQLGVLHSCLGSRLAWASLADGRVDGFTGAASGAGLNGFFGPDADRR